MEKGFQKLVATIPAEMKKLLEKDNFMELIKDTYQMGYVDCAHMMMSSLKDAIPTK